MIPTGRLYDVAVACKDAVVAYYTAEGEDLPARAYVANGLPAFDLAEDEDCGEQFTVFVESIYGHQGNPLTEDPSAHLGEAGHAMRAAVVALTVVRCVPTIDDHGHGGHPSIPTVAEEEASAEQIYADAVLVLNGLLVAQRAGELPGCGSVGFLRWTNENAQGGVGGGTLRVVISLSDAF